MSKNRSPGLDLRHAQTDSSTNSPKALSLGESHSCLRTNPTLVHTAVKSRLRRHRVRRTYVSRPACTSDSSIRRTILSCGSSRSTTRLLISARICSPRGLALCKGIFSDLPVLETVHHQTYR